MRFATGSITYNVLTTYLGTDAEIALARLSHLLSDSTPVQPLKEGSGRNSSIERFNMVDGRRSRHFELFRVNRRCGAGLRGRKKGGGVVDRDNLDTGRQAIQSCCYPNSHPP